MTDRQRIIKRLDDLVSDIVIARDKNCITCGSKNSPTCGHFMPRRHLATRWNLTNCNRQCWECNGRDDWEEYLEMMFITCGDKKAREIITLAHSTVKFSNNDLKELYNELLVIRKNQINGNTE